jgi:general L-amino acid transport system permease protein
MNAQENMDTRGIEFGFGFLSKEASFDIQFSLIDYDGSMSYARAYLVGLLNTLLVSFIGIILCTLLGAVIGVARLSPNYLISKTASFYIEFFRNIPLLLQIFFLVFCSIASSTNARGCSINIWFLIYDYKGTLYTSTSLE